LETGGGTRLKILEAFAAGLPVVTTPIGCEGLEVRHSDHLLIAKREEFDEAILALLSDAALSLRLASSARQLVRKAYEWRSIGDTASDHIAAAVEDSSHRSSDRRCQSVS
jgi:glycosyltransferase involved in cell wall biosynthesis